MLGMLARQISKTAGIDATGCTLLNQVRTKRAVDARPKSANASRNVEARPAEIGAMEEVALPRLRTVTSPV